MKKFMKITMVSLLMVAMLLGFVPALPATTVSAARTSANTYKHVVVVGIDGLGNFEQKTSTPNIDKLFKNNPNAAWTDYGMASNPNISAQCWTSMITGVMPNVHGITNDIAENTSIKYNNPDYPTIFKYLRQARPDAKIGLFSSWEAVPNGMVEVGLNVDTYSNACDDDTLLTKCVSYIKANKPDLFFCTFNEVDNAGHGYNWGSAEYLAEVRQADAYIGQMYQAVKDAGMLDDTLFIVTTDHGGWTNGHGVRTTTTKYCFTGFIGKTINPNTNVYYRGVDLAAIMGYALNISGNSKWESVIPQNLFKENMSPKFSPHPDTLTAGHHLSSPRVTPASGLDGYIGNFIDMNKLETALFFDGNVNDYMGNQTAVAKGTVKYVNGYFGKGVNLENGYVSLPNLKMGTSSFTIGLWMKQNGEYNGAADPVIFSNKQWDAGMGSSDGVIFTEWGNDPAFRVSKNGTNNQHRPTYPGEAQTTIDIDTTGDWVATSWDDCWVHVLLVVDRSANKLKVYYNFVLAGEYNMADWVKGMSFDTQYPFNIGQDADGNYNMSLKSYLDDFMFFNTALNQTDVDGLRKYYTPVITGSAPTRASVTTNKTAYNVGETVKFNMSADGYSNTLWVYCPDGTSKYFQEASSPYAMTFSTKGNYSALVQTWNGKGSFTSQKVSFTVGVETPTTQTTTATTTASTTKATTASTTASTTKTTASTTASTSASTTAPTTVPTTAPTTVSTAPPTTISTTAPTTVSTQPGAEDPCLKGHTYQNGFCIYCAAHDPNYDPCEKGHTFRDGHCIYCLEPDPDYDPCAEGHTFRNGYCIYCLERDPEWNPDIPTTENTTAATTTATQSTAATTQPSANNQNTDGDENPYWIFIVLTIATMCIAIAAVLIVLKKKK